MLQSNGYPNNFIKQATRPSRGTSTTSNEPENALPTIMGWLPYSSPTVSSSKTNPYNVKIALKSHSALRLDIVNVIGPVPIYSGAKSSTKFHARVAIRPTLDK